MSRFLVAIAIVVAIGCSTKKPATVERDGTDHSGTSRDSVEVERLDGSLVDPLTQPENPTAHVFVFLTTDCPIANRYAPTLQRLANRCREENIAFTLVYPNQTDTAEAIQEHLKQYNHDCAAVRDVNQQLVAKTGVTVTPEAAVFDATGTMVYRGRIDDWYVDFGKYRRAPTTHDLDDAISCVIAGSPVRNPITKAIGCYIHNRTGSTKSDGR